MQFDEIDIQQIWQKILNIMEKNLNKATYETWVKRTEPLTVSGNVFIVGVPNEFAKDWLETRYNNFIEECISEITGQEIKVTYKILKILDQNENLGGDIREIKPMPPIEKNNSNANNNDYFASSLNPKYTFDTFVVGNSNKFAHAAAIAVAESPARSYNPLFIYGGVGLGKTHIMHAVGQYILEQNPSARILYLSSEKFTNDLINAIKDEKTLEFRNRYRNIDVLLVDDIQFIAGKERTQEEFFHTFNSLHENNKQIVISSDRPPKEIPTLESRLRSRFEWGLITDIQPPDLETRIAILRKKASMEKLNVPNDVMIYIANQIQANIRELEGALIRVVAYSSLNHSEISVQLASEALKDILPANKRRQISIELIQQAVAEYYNLKFDDMKAKKRTKSLAFPRQVAMYLCRELTDSSLPKIGDEFGGRDHTTVIHAYEKIKDGLTSDQNLDYAIKELIKKIENS